jgi:hypothetical protein
MQKKIDPKVIERVNYKIIPILSVILDIFLIINLSHISIFSRFNFKPLSHPGFRVFAALRPE